MGLEVSLGCGVVEGESEDGMLEIEIAGVVVSARTRCECGSG